MNCHLIIVAMTEKYARTHRIMLMLIIICRLEIDRKL